MATTVEGNVGFTTMTGHQQRPTPGAKLASAFKGAFEERARAAGGVACFVRF